MTTVYLMRHSEPLRMCFESYNASENEQIRNEKNPLSINGEKYAEEMSNYSGLLNIDVLYASHYVRAISTAKYIASKNDIKINIEERLGERKFGVNDISELPASFSENQFGNWNYKLENGESLNEVSLRMNEVIKEILINNKGKKIAIVSHATAISSMLKTWCDIKLNEETKSVEIFFNNKLVFNGKWNSPELFKLIFDDNNNLYDIQNIVFK